MRARVAMPTSVKDFPEAQPRPELLEVRPPPGPPAVRKAADQTEWAMKVPSGRPPTI